MTVEKSTDWLIDLLYAEDDEDMLDSTEADLPTDQLEEYESMQAMLSEIRTAWPMETPSASVTQALLAAANDTAAAQTESQAQAARMPRATRSATGSIWSRVRAQTLVQISTVAVVLLTGTFFLGQMAQQEPERSAAAPMEVAVRDTAQPAPGAAANDFPAQLQKPQTPTPKPVITDPSQTLALKKSNETNRQDKESDYAPAVSTKRSSKSRTRKKKDSVRFGDDTLLRQNTKPLKYAAEPQKKAAPKPAPIPRVSSGSFGQEGPTVGKVTEPESVVAPARAARSSARVRGASTSNQMAEVAPSVEPSAPPMADVADPVAVPADASAKLKAAPKKDSAPALPTVSGIERSSRAAQHDRTITQADRFLKAGLGSVAQRVRVMTLKAQAHSKMGQSSRADAIYSEIARTYPEYAKKKNVRRKKSKAKSKPMKRPAELDSLQSF